MDQPKIVEANHISKYYRLYDHPTDRLKEAINPFRKKYHKDFYALNNISFEVFKGETVGILGKNGSGKSTLLKILTGVLTPTEGSVSLNGKVAALLELGAGFNPEYTGIENIYINGALMGYSREEMEGRLHNILSFADIGDFVYQPVKTYSSGMFARLAFAVSINVDPNVFIIDEALSVGDVFFQQKCFEKIKELKEKGVTILFVSHDVASISTLCDRCILLHNGKLFSTGEPRKIINDYVRLNTMENNDDPIPQKDIHIEPVDGKEFSDPTKQNSEDPTTEEYRYGDCTADIQSIEFSSEGNPDWLVYTMENFELTMNVRFYEDCKNPVAAFYIKNKRGVELYSGNTHYLERNIGPVKSGDAVRITFRQKMVLAPDEYIVSFGLSDFINGESRPLDRRYDLYKLIVKSPRTIIGMVDMDSQVRIQKVRSNENSAGRNFQR